LVRKINPLYRRQELATELKSGRSMDKKGWVLAHNSTLQKMRWYLPVDLKKIINKYLQARIKRRKPRILDLGCTGGIALAELFEQFGNSLEYHGMSLSPFFREWREIAAKSNGTIKFHVGHAEGIAKRFKPAFFDVIYSNLGIAHAMDIDNALKNARNILRKRGLLIFNISARGLEKTPGFRTIMKCTVESFGSPKKTFVLEKI